MRWPTTCGRALALLALCSACSSSSFRSLGKSEEARDRRITRVVEPPFKISADRLLVCLEATNERFQFKTRGSSEEFIEKDGASVGLRATVLLESGRTVPLSSPYSIGGGGNLSYCRNESGLRGERVVRVDLELSREVSGVTIALRSLTPP